MFYKKSGGLCLKFNRSSFLLNLIIVLQMFLYTTYTFSGSRLSLYLNPLIGVGGLVYFIITTKSSRIKFSVLIGALCIFMFGVLNMFFVENMNSSLIIREIFTYYTTACLLTKKQVNKKLMLFMFYCFTLYTWGKILMVGHPYRIFYYQSRNYIGVYLLVMLFPYYTTFVNKSDNNRDDVSILPAILCLITSAYTLGRGSMIMSFILVYGTILKNIILNKNNRNKGKKILISITLIIASFVIFMVSDIKEDYLFRFYSGDSSNEMRFKIWDAYLTPIISSPYSFVFGLNLYSNSLLSQFLGNAHNSYIMTHAYFGICGSLVFVFGIINTIKRNIKFYNFDMIIFSCAFLIKAFTDWVFPLQIGDIIILYLIISNFIIKDQHRKSDN